MHTGAMQGHSTVKRQTLNSTPSTYNDPFANLHSKLRSKLPFLYENANQLKPQDRTEVTAILPTPIFCQNFLKKKLKNLFDKF